MSLLRFLPVLVLFAALAGCRKDALDVHPDLEGTWVSQQFDSAGGRQIFIGASGLIKDWKNTLLSSGEPKIRKNMLKIGGWKMQIIEYPHYDADGNYMLILDSGNYYAARVPVGYGASVSGTSVTFSWTRYDADFGHKVIDYRLLPAGSWTTVETSGPGWYTISGLQQGNYEWRMKTVNENHSSLYTPTGSFVIQ